MNACYQHCGRPVTDTTSWRSRSASHHVSLPDLTREFKRIYYNELPPTEYDRILAEHRPAILDLIAELNTSNE